MAAAEDPYCGGAGVVHGDDVHPAGPYLEGHEVVGVADGVFGPRVVGDVRDGDGSEACGGGFDGGGNGVGGDGNVVGVEMSVVGFVGDGDDGKGGDVSGGGRVASGGVYVDSDDDVGMLQKAHVGMNLGGGGGGGDGGGGGGGVGEVEEHRNHLF